jgi:hypothetical protein
MNVVKHILTGIDGETYDPSRVLWTIGVLFFLVCETITVYRSGVFDLVNYSIAFSTLLAGGAVGVKIKETTEPPAKASIQPIAATKDVEQ